MAAVRHASNFRLNFKATLFETDRKKLVGSLNVLGCQTTGNCPGTNAWRRSESCEMQGDFVNK